MRKTVFKSLPIVGALTLAATVLTIGASAASSSAPYKNGFETKGDVNMPNKEMLNVDRVPSGTANYTAASGKWFGLAPIASDTVNTFTRYGGYNNAFPTGGYTTSVDIYLGAAEQFRPGFDYSSAINDPKGDHRRDFIFNVAPGSGGLVVSASNNAPGSANPAGPPTITENGWYTFQHNFHADANNQLVVDMTVSKLGVATPLATWRLSDPSDIIGTTVGGNRYGWLLNNTQELAIDNVTRTNA